MYSRLLCVKCNNMTSSCVRGAFIGTMSRPVLFTNQKLANNNQQLAQFTQISSSKNEGILLRSPQVWQNLVRTVIKGGPGYTKFGHGRTKVNLSRYAYFYYAFLFGGLTFLMFFDPENILINGEEAEQKMKDMRNLYSRDTVPKAKEITAETDAENEIVDKKEGDKKDSEAKISKKSFRNRKIIQYENRLRQFSTPDKIFRYFATAQVMNVKSNEYEVFMTPNDFLRSITYGVIQPEGLGLDSYNKYDSKLSKLELNLSEGSIFKRLSPKGLISFSDYIFLVTMLSTPTRHFEIAFHMFDIDGNGNIDIGEFEHLQGIIRNQTSIGQRHRDTHMTGSVIKGNSTLNEYFFGTDKSELLTVRKFIDFQQRLQTECIEKEFEFHAHKTRASDNQKIISDLSFCEMILAYAGFNGTKTKQMLKRVADMFNETKKGQNGVTLKEYQDFFQVLRSIHDIDTALKFYSIAGASIDKGILKHVAKTVANIELSDHILEVIFHLFDEDGDGKLSQKEFIQVMKKKLSSGLQNPKDTGFVKLLESLAVCSKETFF